jgi:hypothetical protein
MGLALASSILCWTIDRRHKLLLFFGFPCLHWKHGAFGTRDFKLQGCSSTHLGNGQLTDCETD